MSSVTIATSLDHALSALATGARPVAGGTDLVVGARQGKAPLPNDLIAIDRLDELRTLTVTSSGLRIGALVTHSQIVSDTTVSASFTALADASAIVGSHATRAHGTIGGNVMNASPAMDTGGPLLCLGAVAVLQSAAGSRHVPLAELWLSPGQTTARPDELLVAIEVPSFDGGSCYARLEYRQQMEIAIVGATAVVSVANGVVTDARLAMTALSPVIVRVPAAESALVGQPVGRASAEAAASLFAAATAPISDVRASADYRRAMAAVIARRAIEAALLRATGGEVAIPASSSLHGAR